MRLSTAQSEMLSTDGPYLQYILIKSKPLQQGFRYTRRKLEASMLPHEAAQLIIDNLKADPMIHRFELIDNKPIVLDGREGFRLVYAYRDANDVEMKTIYYGVLFADRFFNLRYTATRRHYFSAQRPAFDRLVTSLHFVSALQPADLAKR